MKTYFLMGCLLAALTTYATESLGADEAEESSITLERTLCYGKCPSYRMTVYSSGAYAWEGRKYVSRLGKHQGRINRKVFEDAMKLLQDYRYLEFKDNYADYTGCTSMSTDSPSAIIEVKGPVGPKRIKHYHGCEGFARQSELFELEKKLDEALNTKRFNTRGD